MKRRCRSLGLLLPFAVAALSSCDEGTTVHSAPADGGADAVEVELRVQGSYAFELTDIESDGGPMPLLDRGRIDVRGAGATLEAAVHFAGGVGIGAFSTRREGEELVLEGLVFGSREGLFGKYTTERWSELRLGLSHDGSLSGALTVVGEREVTDLNYGSLQASPWSARGWIGPDAIAPQISFPMARSPQGPDDAYLPWDEIRMLASEPLSAEQTSLAVALVPAGDSGAASSVQPWEPVFGAWNSEEPRWAGAAVFRTRLTDWTQTGHLPHGVALRGTASDPSGNAVSAGDIVLPMMPVGPPASPIDFHDAGGVAVWGIASTTPLECACESGTCATIGPVQARSKVDIGCALSGGIALRVATEGASMVRIAYRLLVDDTSAAWKTDGAGDYRIDVVPPNGATATEVAFPSEWDGGPLAVACGGLTQATAWRELDIVLASPRAELALVVRPKEPTAPCDPEPSVARQLVIRSVTAL